MKKPIFYLSGFALIMLFTISCVSGRKYSSLQDTSRQFMRERDAFKTDNIALEMTNKELEAKLAGLQKETETIKDDIQKVQAERDRAKDDYNKISAQYEELQNSHEDLVRGNVRETQKLLSELQAAQDNLQKKEALLRQLSDNLDAKKTSLDELTFELNKRNA